MSSEWVEAGMLITEVAKIGLAVGAGVWGYHRFVRERTHAPQIEFDVNCSFFGPQSGAYVAEFTLTFLNKGLTRQEVRQVRLRARGIKHGEKLAHWPSREPRLQFPEKVFVEKNIVPERYTYMFVEPKVNQYYKYVTHVPEQMAFIIVNAEFIYKDGEEHSAERVFEVKASLAR